MGREPGQGLVLVHVLIHSDLLNRERSATGMTKDGRDLSAGSGRSGHLSVAARASPWIPNVHGLAAMATHRRTLTVRPAIVHPEGEGRRMSWSVLGARKEKIKAKD